MVFCPTELLGVITLNSSGNSAVVVGPFSHSTSETRAADPLSVVLVLIIKINSSVAISGAWRTNVQRPLLHGVECLRARGDRRREQGSWRWCWR